LHQDIVNPGFGRRTGARSWLSQAIQNVEVMSLKLLSKAAKRKKRQSRYLELTYKLLVEVAPSTQEQ
jgi:hypothetical protein